MAALALKQIERGQTTMTTTATQSTVTLGTTLTSTSKAFLVFTVRTTGADTRDYSVGGKILSTTQIQFNRATGVLNTAVIEWQVVEFTAGINVQHVEVTMSATTVNTTITAVGDINKSFAMTTNRNTGTGWGTDDLAIAELTTTSNLQMRITAVAASNVQNVQVIEIDDASVQKFVTTYGTGTTKDITVTTIDPAKTFWFFSATTPGTIDNTQLPYLAYVNSTTLRFTRVNAAGQNYNLCVYVVSLSAGLTVQNVSTTIASSASTVSPTISTVTVANTLLILNGIYHRFASANEANDAATTSAFALASLGTTSFTATRATAPALAATTNVQVLAFSTGAAGATRGTPFGHRGTAFNGGRTFHGIIQ
jgi:hypothetical protein